MAVYSSNLIILFPTGCCLYVAMRLADARGGKRSDSLASVIIYTLSALMIATSLVGLLFRISLPSLPLFMCLALVGTILFAKHLLLRRSALFLSFISVKSDWQAQRMAADFALLNSGLVRKRARAVQRLLSLGKNRAEAMELSRVAKADYEIICCRLVSRYGFSAYQALPAQLHPLRIHTEMERQMGRLALLPWLLPGLAVVGVIVFLVAPVLVEIREEFDLSVGSVHLLEDLQQKMLQFPYNLLLVLLVLASLLFSCLILCLLTVPQLIQIFPFRPLASAYHRALSLLALSAASQREPELVTAAQVASELVPTTFLSRRLQMTSQLVGQGVSPQLAFSQTGVLKRNEAAALGQAINANSLAWGVQELAIAQSEKMLRHLSIFTQSAVILLILLFAAIYGMLAYVVFDILSQFILQMS